MIIKIATNANKKFPRFLIILFDLIPESSNYWLSLRDVLLEKVKILSNSLSVSISLKFTKSIIVWQTNWELDG
jgi:hypothetical protein